MIADLQPKSYSVQEIRGLEVLKPHVVQQLFPPSIAAACEARSKMVEGYKCRALDLGLGAFGFGVCGLDAKSLGFGIWGVGFGVFGLGFGFGVRGLCFGLWVVALRV